MRTIMLSQMVACVLTLGQVGFAQDLAQDKTQQNTVDLRGKVEPFSFAPASATNGGVQILLDGKQTIVSWDRVRQANTSDTKAIALTQLGTDLMRVRLRIERNDVDFAATLAEDLFARLDKSYQIAGPTGALASECVLRVRLSRGSFGLATQAWLTWLVVEATRPGAQTQSGQNTQAGLAEPVQWLGQSLAIASIFADENSLTPGLCVQLPPMYSVGLAEQSLRDLDAWDGWGKIALGSASAGKVAQWYRLAVQHELGLNPTLLAVPGEQASDSEKLVADIVLARAGDAAIRQSARERLVRRMNAIVRNEQTLEASDRGDGDSGDAAGGLSQVDRAWEKAWLHAAIGRSLIVESSQDSKRKGLIELLTVPALFGETYPLVAIVALLDARAELERMGEPREQIEQLEQQLRTKFDVQAPADTTKGLQTR